MFKIKPFLFEILPFFLLFLLYGFLTYPCIYFWDSGEFSLISTFLGVPHPTGYPLYIQLLKLFSFTPVGSPFFLQNFFSALFATFSAFILFKLCHQITNHYQASLVASLSFAISPVFLNKATMAEVYTLQIFIILLIVYLGYSLIHSWDTRKIWMISFLLGLGASHHMMTIFLIPAFLYLLFIAPKETKKLKIYLLIILFGIVGLFPYIFILFRNHLLPPVFFPKWFGIKMDCISDWYWLLSGKLHRVDMSSFSLTRYIKDFGFFGFLLFRDFYWVGGVLGLLGLIKYFKIEKRPAIFLSLVFFSHVAFFIHYNIPDIFDYYPITYSVWAIWVSIGLTQLIIFFEPVLSSATSKLLHFGILLFLLVPLTLLTEANKTFDPELSPLTYTHKILAFPEKGFSLITSYTTTSTFWFFQQLTPIRPDIEIYDQVIVHLRERARLAQLLNIQDEQFPTYIKNNLKNKIEQKIYKEIKKKNVYIDRDEGILHEKFIQKKIFEGFNRIFLKDTPKVLDGIPPNATQISLKFSPSIQLLGYSITPTKQTEGEFFIVRFYWKRLGEVPRDIGGVVKFQSKEAGNSSSTEEGFSIDFTLGSGLFHPSEWPQDKIVEEFFQSTTKSVLPGQYIISILLYDKINNRILLPEVSTNKIQDGYSPIGVTQIASNPSITHYWDKN
jgi:hypothetical protein